MKNYYEILEVDKNASQEVIDKAYRILAKKYHPDLQQGVAQQESAEKMKIINAAYDVLSDQSKREEYDQQLEAELQESEISIEEHERIMRENYVLKQELNKRANQQMNEPTDEGSFGNMNRVLNEQIQAAYEKAYHDAYIQDLRNRGYKIRYTHDFKYYVKLVVAIAITIAICFLIYQIPFVKNYFETLYYENAIFQAIVDIIKNTFSTGF